MSLDTEAARKRRAGARSRALQPKGEGEEGEGADDHGSYVWWSCRSGAARSLGAGTGVENRILVDLGLIKRFQFGNLLPCRFYSAHPNIQIQPHCAVEQ